MAERQMTADFFKQEKSEEDLRAIISSLNKSRIKFDTQTIAVGKTDLIYKIVDNLKVTKPKATEYLMILQSRGRIVIDHDVVCFTVRDEKNLEEEAKREIDKYLESSEIKTADEKNVN